MLNYRRGTEARRGGLDLVLSLTEDQAAALGGDVVDLAEGLETVLVGLAALRTGRDPRPGPGHGMSLKDHPVQLDQAWDEWLLQDVSALLTRLEGVRNAAIRAHADHGGSHGQLAVAMGVARSTAQSRRADLARTTPGAAELWAIGGYAPVDHPGITVPSTSRSWGMPWHGYTPVDITPPELRPEGLAASVTEGWAEPYASPDDVLDWPDRQATALIPFDRDDRGWPLNPTGRTGRAGRNLGRWGENAAADPIVIAGADADRHVLLIKRADNDRWAIPGGMVDPGETAPAALVRELREETGVDLTEVEPMILTRTYVEDWRNTDHAWVCSTVALYQLPEQLAATAADDATDAQWWPLGDLEQLTQALAVAGGQLYEAHRPQLATALGRLKD